MKPKNKQINMKTATKHGTVRITPDIPEIPLNSAASMESFVLTNKKSNN